MRGKMLVIGTGLIAAASAACSAAMISAVDSQAVDATGPQSDTAAPDIGAVSGGTTLRSAVIVFDISGFTDDVQSATLQFTITGRLSGASSQINGDLYQLRSSSSATILSSDHYAGANDAANTKLAEDLINGPADGTDSIAGDKPSHSSATLVNFLNASLAANQNYVFFRFSPDITSTTQNGRRWEIGGVTNTDTTVRPVLDYTLVPEPSTLSLLTLAAVPMLRRRRGV